MKKISDAVIKRLPKYYRYLTELYTNGIKRVSSSEMSRQTGMTASQIRQDLNCFGGFGQQGYGYNVAQLRNELRQLLGLGRSYSMIIIGAGHIGQALANYSGFAKEGFKVAGMFDVMPVMTPNANKGMHIMHVDMLDQYLEANVVDIAVISVPTKDAQNIADTLCKHDVKYIWNFTPRELSVPVGVVVENVNLIDSLFMLSYKAGNHS